MKQTFKRMAMTLPGCLVRAAKSGTWMLWSEEAHSVCATVEEGTIALVGFNRHLPPVSDNRQGPPPRFVTRVTCIAIARTSISFSFASP
jgi:hypothetical protein